MYRSVRISPVLHNNGYFCVSIPKGCVNRTGPHRYVCLKSAAASQAEQKSPLLLKKCESSYPEALVTSLGALINHT